MRGVIRQRQLLIWVEIGYYPRALAIKERCWRLFTKKMVLGLITGSSIKSLLVFILVSSTCLANTFPDQLVLAYEPEHLNHSQSAHASPIAKRLADALGAELVYFQCPWARCIRAAQQGQVDIIDHLFVSEGRKQYLTFLQPPYSKYQANFRFFALKRRNLAVSAFSELSQISVGVVRGNVYFEEFDNSENINKVFSVSENQLIDLVKLGRVDSFIASATMTDAMIQRRDPDRQLEALSYQHREYKGVHIAVSKQSKWHRHLPVLEKHLQEIVLAKYKTRLKLD